MFISTIQQYVYLQIYVYLRYNRLNQRRVVPPNQCREFKDVVSEDVVFDNSCFVTICCGKPH